MLVLARTTKTYSETTRWRVSSLKKSKDVNIYFHRDYMPVATLGTLVLSLVHSEVLAEDSSQGRDLRWKSSEVAWITKVTRKAPA